MCAQIRWTRTYQYSRWTKLYGMGSRAVHHGREVLAEWQKEA